MGVHSWCSTWLLQEIRQALQPLTSDQHIQDPQQAGETLPTAIELLESLDHRQLAMRLHSTAGLSAQLPLILDGSACKAFYISVRCVAGVHHPHA